MKPTIEGRFLVRNITGTERYILELLSFFSTTQNIDSIDLLISPDYTIAPFLSKVQGIQNLFSEEKIELFHKTYQIGNIWQLFELLIPKKTVITVHDLIMCKYGDYFKEEEKRQEFSDLMELSLTFVDKIIAISNHNKKDIIDVFGIPEEKIEVVYHGIDRNKFKKIKDTKELKDLKEAFDLPEKYFLYLGTNYPHKNLQSLIKAFVLFSKQTEIADYHLVIGGMEYYHRGNDYLKEELRGLGDRVHFLGFVNDKFIPLLYNEAEIFIYPSLYEGFGFPLLESFACETPVICSNITSIPEIAGGAAYVVDTTNEENIVKAMIEIIQNDNLKKEFVGKGLERIKEFTWEKAAQNTAKVYEMALRSPAAFPAKENLLLSKICKTIVRDKTVFNIDGSVKPKLIHLIFQEFMDSLKKDGMQKTMGKTFKALLR